MALSADRAVEVQGLSEKIPVVLTASITYYKGSILCFTAAGGLAIKAADTAAYGKLAGVLTKGVVAPASPATNAEIEIGKIWIPFASAAQADVGDFVYATDDGTIAMSATNADPIGVVVAVRVGVASLVDFRKGCPKTALA
jgi:hypothetical protein